MTTCAPPPQVTLGELRAAGHVPRSLREEISRNLQRAMVSGEPLFPGILGYEDTVIPALENALLCGHDLIFLGERGQAKTRMIRAIVGLLDDWIPIVAGSEINDDPFAPASRYAQDRIEQEGDATPIEWISSDARYGEKLATPDVSIADLIGDVDPIKVAEGHYLSDEYTMHFGLLPRTNRGVFCINELPDLTEKVQVGLFNVMEERDIQVKGFRVRMPLDILVVASANPEDYTSRGRIITPLKDRYAAQIRTHYPKQRSLELAIAKQESKLPVLDGQELVLPDYMSEIVAEATLQARSCPDISQASGVSVRMTIANLETLVANAVRRALRTGESEVVPRISDLAALLGSSRGKIELEYAGVENTEDDVVLDLLRRATRVIFDECVAAEDIKPIVEAFDQGWRVEVSENQPAAGYLDGLDEISGMRPLAERLADGATPGRLASAIEFVLEGLHLQNQLNKDTVEEGSRFQAKREPHDVSEPRDLRDE